MQEQKTLRWKLLLSNCFALALLVGFTAQGATPTPEDFDKQIVITPSVDLGGNTYTDVPVLVRLGTQIKDFDYSLFRQTGGADLMFFDTDGNPLPHEIDTWDETGTSYVWVKLPTLTSATSFFACLGSDAEMPAPSAASVWGGYKGVWHFSGGAGTDSTGNHDATHGENFATATGGIGNGLAQSGQDMLVLTAADCALGSQFTISGYLYHNSGTVSWDHWFYRKASAGDANGIAMESQNKVNEVNVYGAGGKKWTLTTGMSAGAWYWMDFVYDGTTARIYCNGTLAGETNEGGINAATDGTLPLVFGGNAEGTSESYWRGSVDEIRVRTEVPDAARLRVEYLLQGDATALSYSAVANVGLPVLGETTITRRADGAFVVSVELLSGRGTVKAICNGTVECPISDGIVSGAQTLSAALTGLADDTSYTYSVVAVAEDGTEVVREGSTVFYSGSLAVNKSIDAYPRNAAAGLVTVSRAKTAASIQYDLPFTYTVGGTAVAGTDYESLSGTATIPAGLASVTIAVTPLAGVVPANPKTVTLAVDPFYAPEDNVAEVSILTGDLRKQFHRRMSVTVAKYPGEAAQTDFPALVRIPAATAGTGTGLAFFSEDGALLPHEVDTWDPDGESLVWVKIPTLANNETFYAYYRHDTGADFANPAALWSDYIAVYHLNEPGNGVQPAYDSTAHQLNGTSDSHNLAVAKGIIGAARSPAQTLTGSDTAGRILVPYRKELDITGQNLSVSFWVRPTKSPKWAYLMGRRFGDSAGGWGFQDDNAGGYIRFWENDTKRDSCGPIGPNRWVMNTWYKFNCHYVGNHAYFYAGGGANYSGNVDATTYDRNLSVAPTNGGTESLAIGGAAGTGNGTGFAFPGDFDEVRITERIDPEEWVASEYLQETDATFYTYGAPESVSHGFMVIVK